MKLWHATQKKAAMAWWNDGDVSEWTCSFSAHGDA